MKGGEVKYFVSAEGKQLGPCSAHQLRTKLFRKTISVEDYIWREGLGDQWVQIKTLMDELPAEAVPPPAPEVPELGRIRIADHPDGTPDTILTVPPKGPYEPPATLKQKNLL